MHVWPLILACLFGLLAPSFTLGEERAASAALDVRLSPEGLLHGQVLTPSGGPLAGATVSVRRGGLPLMSAATDAHGRFAVPLPGGGMYEVEAAGDRRICRVWTASAAPPNARGELLLLEQAAVLRGRSTLGRGYAPAVNTALGAGFLLVPFFIQTETKDLPSGS